MKSICFAALLLLVSIPAHATPGNANPPGDPSPSGNAYGIRGKPTAPAPILGAGLPFIALGASLVYLYRRRRK